MQWGRVKITQEALFVKREGTDRLNIFPPTRFSTSLSLYRPAPFTILPLSVGTSVFTALCFQRLSEISHKGCFHSVMANHMSQGLQQNLIIIIIK